MRAGRDSLKKCPDGDPLMLRLFKSEESLSPETMKSGPAVNDLTAVSCQVFREVSNYATFRDNSLTDKNLRSGGEGGIRTHVPVTRQDAFEAPPLRPLRYLSGRVRRGGSKDQPPRTVRATGVTRTSDYTFLFRQA